MRSSKHKRSKAELDAMSEEDKEKAIMEDIYHFGAVRLDRRDQLAFWGGAIDRLREAGKVKVRDIGSDEDQCTCLQVTAKKGGE